MTVRTKWTGAALVAAAAVGGCSAATNQPVESNSFANAVTTVLVRNDHWADVALYVATPGGLPVRIGTVGGFSEGRIRVNPASFSSSGVVVFIAEPIGSRSGFQSEPVPFPAGSTADLRLGNNLRMSHVFVR